ncbi:sodium hydrogen exchanger 3, partial [Nannochloropsis oceanica]
MATALAGAFVRLLFVIGDDAPAATKAAAEAAAAAAANDAAMAPAPSVSHEFGALNTLLLVLVLGLCILSAYLVKAFKFYYLPESAAAILVGLIVGGFARLFSPSKDELDFLSFRPELFFFLFLPPIIFEAGYTLRKKQFFSNFWTILFYAVGGTLLSTFMVGGLTYGLGKMGIIPIDTHNPMEALCFGSLISAVDPVATLSIIGSPELHCNPLLYSLLFG